MSSFKPLSAHWHAVEGQVGMSPNTAERLKVLNSSCSRPQQLSTYALTLYKHSATVGNKTVAVGMYRAAAFFKNFTQLKIVLWKITIKSAEMFFLFVCLFLIHRFLGHRRSGEISEHASLILPQSTRMHHGKTQDRTGFSSNLACPFSLSTKNLQGDKLRIISNK